MRSVSLLRALALAVLAVCGCATVPLSQRSQLVLLSDSQLTALGAESYRKILSEAHLSDDPVQTSMVRTVGLRLSVAAEEWLRENGLPAEGYDWEFNLIDDDQVANAWCLPGGKVAVYTGILKYTQDECGLAVVMAHEIAHALARHGNERMSQALLFELGGATLSYALREKPAKTRGLFLASYGVAGQIGVLLPYSRVQESEADRIGLTLMAKAGYDPRCALDFWKRMAASSGPRVPELLSTHPAPESRIKKIEQYLREALQAAERGPAAR